MEWGWGGEFEYFWLELHQRGSFISKILCFLCSIYTITFCQKYIYLIITPKEKTKLSSLQKSFLSYTVVFRGMNRQMKSRFLRWAFEQSACHKAMFEWQQRNRFAWQNPACTEERVAGNLTFCCCADWLFQTFWHYPSYSMHMFHCIAMQCSSSFLSRQKVKSVISTSYSLADFNFILFLYFVEKVWRMNMLFLRVDVYFFKEHNGTTKSDNGYHPRPTLRWHEWYNACTLNERVLRTSLLNLQEHSFGMLH